MVMIKVGRSSQNDYVVQHDEYVGRTHCAFILDEHGEYWVVDLNSKNGTYVNGVRRAGKTKLNSNDIVRIGNSIVPWKSLLDHYAPTPTPKRLGKAALICGIIGLGVPVLGLVPGILGIVFGGKVLRRQERPKALGVLGLVFGIIGVVISSIIIIILNIENGII